MSQPFATLPQVVRVPDGQPSNSAARQEIIRVFFFAQQQLALVKTTSKIILSGMQILGDKRQDRGSEEYITNDYVARK